MLDLHLDETFRDTMELTMSYSKMHLILNRQYTAYLLSSPVVCIHEHETTAAIS